MSAKNLSIFVPINKIDEEQRLVYGQVAAEVVDNSGEVFDYEASKPYFQKWSDNAHVTSGGKSKGNLRVMHTSKVAGVVTDLGFDDENKVIEACAKVIDDNEWNMVKAGAYTGFSMGGRYVNRVEKTDSNGKVVKTYTADPVEISLVDKPCIPTAVFSVVKADGIVEERHFAESVQAEDGIDLEKAQGRHPKGSSKGGQFAPKNGGSGGGGSRFNAGASDPVHGGDGKSKDKPQISSGVKDGDRFRAKGDNWADAPITTGFVNGKGTPKEQIDREVKRRVRLAAKDEKNGHGDRSAMLRSIAKEDRRIAADRMDVAANKAKAGDMAGAARLAGNSKFYIQLAEATEAKAGANKHDDGDPMYVPTNDEILPVARALAKAAGKTEDDWLDFSDQAREELVEKASGKQARHPKGSSKGGQFASGSGALGGAGSGGDLSATASDVAGMKFTAENWKDVPAVGRTLQYGGGTAKQQIDRRVKRYKSEANKSGKDKKEYLTRQAEKHRALASDKVAFYQERANRGMFDSAAQTLATAKFDLEMASALDRAASRVRKGDDFEDLAKAEVMEEEIDMSKGDLEIDDEVLASEQKIEEQAEKDIAAMKADKSDGSEKGKDDDEDDDAEPDTGEPEEDAEGDDEEEEESEEDDAKAEKSDEPEVEQVWKAKDGTTFAKKADAIAHNESLAKADAEPSLADQLRAANAEIERIAKGEVVTDEEEPLEKSDVEQMADALDSILKVDHGGTLAKSMYTVERTARVLRELASLNICVSREQKREGRGESALPGEIGIAVGKMGEVLIDMAKEEVEELLAVVARDGKPKEDGGEISPYYDSYMALAAPTLGLEKADLIAKIDGKLELQKLDAPAEDDTLQKLDAANKRADEAVAKADRLQSEMEELGPLVKSLQAQIEEIKKLPMPKAPTTVAIGKGEQIVDKADVPSNPADVLSKFTPDQLADAAFRMAHQHPRHIGLPNGGGN